MTLGDEVLTVAELIEELQGKVGRSAIYSALAAGEIPSVRIGRRILISRRRFEEWLEGGQVVLTAEQAGNIADTLEGYVGNPEGAKRAALALLSPEVKP